MVSDARVLIYFLGLLCVLGVSALNPTREQLIAEDAKGGAEKTEIDRLLTSQASRIVESRADAR